jgi:hypothetical protein
MTPSNRYYFWQECESYGWRPMGSLAGYDSLDEVWRDSEIRRESQYTLDWVILHATPMVSMADLASRV